MYIASSVRRSHTSEEVCGYHEKEFCWSPCTFRTTLPWNNSELQPPANSNAFHTIRRIGTSSAAKLWQYLNQWRSTICYWNSKMHSACGRDAQARSKALRKIEGEASFGWNWQNGYSANGFGSSVSQRNRKVPGYHVIDWRKPGTTGSQLENFRRSYHCFWTINWRHLITSSFGRSWFDIFSERIFEIVQDF